ncbi:MAG: ATP-dependent helicase HrpB [Archangium sp.]|nr:ATP-dependent helicase HrpB [Archangium sp.]
MPIALPIDSLLPDITAALRTKPALVLEAPPGAGKTTRVPPALLQAGLAGAGEIVVLQPRRLATRLAAARVADELGEAVGATVGYQIRFDEVSSAKTRIRFVTEGVLTRRLVSDPQLRGVGAVLLDEFHERHVAGDLALAMLRRLQLTTRPDLKLLVMSATLDAAPVAAWLGDAPSLRSEGRAHAVSIEFAEKDDDRHLDQQVLAALKRLVQRELDGHVLIFLPGAGEIRRAADTCADFAQRHQLDIHVLHGELPAAEQDRALRPSARRKLILSTNVAETSVTIDGVAAVIDSGLARVASHSPFSGLATLNLAKVSKASATQRAGRAGRTRAGVCIRLYTRGDYEGRPATDVPEIRRLDFTESALSLRALGVTDVSTFPFFEAPAASAVSAADALLHRLGAIDRGGALTPLGQRMATTPLHPRLAKLLLDAEQRGVGDDGAIIAALLGERDIRLETRSGGRHGQKADVWTGPSDLLELLERFHQGHGMGARAAGLESGAFSTVDRVRKQLQRGLRKSNQAPGSDSAKEAALLQAIAAGFPDRVARRRKPQAPELVLSGGGSATLDPSSVVQNDELMIAVDAEERRGAVIVRLASRVEAEWLLELCPDELSELDSLVWNNDGHRVERVTRLSYGKVVLEETRAPAPASEAVSKALADAARAADLSLLADPAAVEAWCCRVEALRAAFPESKFPTADSAFVKETLATMCDGCRSFAEVREVGLMHALNARLAPEQARLLATQAPEKITLPGGRTVTVHYERARPPWIESRLQDFFGLSAGPSIGRSPLVLHLLAPNHEAVQITTDLSGFWDRHYPAVRKELMRHYPRHAWPEDPRTATPPPPNRRR